MKFDSPSNQFLGGSSAAFHQVVKDNASKTKTSNSCKAISSLDIPFLSFHYIEKDSVFRVILSFNGTNI